MREELSRMIHILYLDLSSKVLLHTFKKNILFEGNVSNNNLLMSVIN